MVKKAEKITQKARQAAEKWRQYFQVNIDQYHAFTEFVLGSQWTDDESNMLQTYKKIPLQFNKLATLVNSLLGEQQQNTPQLQVVPMENCDEETANIRELITKDIMFCGGAKNAYQVAASQAFIGGFGAYTLCTDYSYNKSFDQDIVYKHFKDATRCYWDISAEELNKTDGMVCGWLTRMSRAKFREMYGKKIESQIIGDNAISASEEEVAAATSTNATTGAGYTWADDDSVTIQDHFVKKLIPDVLYKLSNGRIVNQDELDEIIDKSRQRMIDMQMMETMQQEMQNEQQMQMGIDAGMEMQAGEVVPPEIQAAEAGQDEALDQEVDEYSDDLITLYDAGEIVRIEDQRTAKKAKITHYKIAGDYVLDQSEFPSEKLPLIFVDQNSYYDKNGKQVCRPFVIDAKDAQKYINYLGTQSAYVLKVSRFDQWIGSKKNVSSNDTAQVWRDPLSQQGMLTYDESPSGAAPKQVTPPELSQSLLTQYQRAIEDLYTSTGLYPTRMGQQGNETSGAAIDARTRQGSYSTYCAFNSINRAIAAGGEVLNEMIPKVYDTERVLTLMTPEEGQQNITINQQEDEYGELIKNDIRKGTYQVRLMAGPSYEGQKEQALQSLNLALQANPQLFNLIADLYAENLPLMNTIELKNRLKSLVPPQIIEAGKTGKSPQEQGPKQPSLEEQAMEADAALKQAQIQAKQQELQIKQRELELKAREQKAETEREHMRLETERLEVAAKLEEQKLRYLAETERTQSDSAIAHADNLTKILTHKIG